MSKFNTSQPSQKNNDDWMISYSDVVTALLAFFVLLVSISTIDQRKIEFIQASIQQNILKIDYEKPFHTLEKEIDVIIEEKDLQKDVLVSADNTGISVTFSSEVLYKSGSAKLQQGMNSILKDISQSIKDMPYQDILIEVDGHTDDIPIRTVQYPSNWELSTARASNVVRTLISYGIDKDKLKASGFADSRPLVNNIGPNGLGIPENRAKNRRVKLSIRRDEYRNMPKVDV